MSRGRGGKSAVAAAAYRAGEVIKSERNGITYDYSRRGGVVYTEIILPVNAPLEYKDRSILWNAVEEVEKAKNSQLAREIRFALPRELTQAQNIYLAREFARKQFVEHGMCADVCVHDSGDGNPHAHIMLTMRPINEDGTWGNRQKKVYIFDDDGNKIYDPVKRQYKCSTVKTTDWNNQDKVEEWRKAWADFANAALEKHGFSERIDHRSLDEQGIDRIPTIHMGISATQMERRGVHTERGDINRSIEVTNRDLRQLRARIKKVKDWLYSVPIVDAPSLVAMMRGTADGHNLKSRWDKITDLKTQAKVLMFLQENNISDVGQLADKVEHMHKRQYDVSKKIKEIDRRKAKLSEHLAQTEIFKKYKTVYKKYVGLEAKKRGVFMDEHVKEIKLYESASQYLKDHLNGRTTIPEKKWLAEQENLTAESYALYEEYYKLKGDVKSVETLRRGAEDLMSESVSERTRAKVQDLDL
jgi:hypothetical protein